jgi:hypothetical protein
MARLKLETLHLDRRERAERRSRLRWTDEYFAAAVRESTSIAEVFRRLGYNAAGGIHRFVTRHIRRLGLDTPPHRGGSWPARSTARRVADELGPVVVRVIKPIAKIPSPKRDLGDERGADSPRHGSGHRARQVLPIAS